MEVTKKRKEAEHLWAELDNIPEEHKKAWMLDRAKQIHQDANVPITLIQMTASHFFHGDSGSDPDSRPKWFDSEKFNRGQRFARDYLASITYANLLSLFALYSFEHDLKPIIASNNSSTPYTSFKRYLSTTLRVNNWYQSDPWSPGSPAYKDIRAVRRIHSLVRKKTAAMSNEEYEKSTKIQDPWCPTLEITRQDFCSACPAPTSNQCPFNLLSLCQSLRKNFLTQGEMAGTQFGFVGFVILKPEFFGIHYSSEEDLDAFVHVWRVIGYLLGIEDDYNFCRGSLKDVRARSRDIIEYWVKPNLRVITPEWEHMIRCIVEGMSYYYPGASYEIALLDLADFMNLKMPRFYKVLSYTQWIRRFIMRFYCNFGLRFDKLRIRFNNFLIKKINIATMLDTGMHEELQKKSKETLEFYATSNNSKFLTKKSHFK